jgi:hypothetical protein
LPESVRFGKGIHYTKNVDVIYTHWARHFRGKFMNADARNGEFHVHYRNDMSDYYKADRKLVTSIRDLSIDVEYLVHMIKTYTNTCGDKTLN